MQFFKNKLGLAVCFAGLTALVACGDVFAGVGISLQVGVAPPPQIVEAVPVHHRGVIWIPGFWNWNGQGYVWLPGHHERERRGYRYIVPAWQMVGDAWTFQPGYWVPANSAPTYVQLPPGAPVMVPPAPLGYGTSQPTPGGGSPVQIPAMPYGTTHTVPQPVIVQPATPSGAGVPSQ
jgi:hypothetical protein